MRRRDEAGQPRPAVFCAGQPRYGLNGDPLSLSPPYLLSSTFGRRATLTRSCLAVALQMPSGREI